MTDQAENKIKSLVIALSMGAAVLALVGIAYPVLNRPFAHPGQKGLVLQRAAGSLAPKSSGSAVSSGSPESLPPDPTPLTVTEIQACNRNATVYRPRTEQAEAPEAAPKRYKDLAIGESAWISYLDSYQGKVFVDFYVEASRTRSTDHKILVRREAAGALVDCNSTIWIYVNQVQAGDFAPVIGQMHTIQGKP